MPDPIANGCNAIPPINISAVPPTNSQEEIVIFGCASKKASPASMTIAQARSEISKRCRGLRLSRSTTNALLKSLKLTGNSSAPVDAHAKQGIQMLKTLQNVVKDIPKLSSVERDQFVGIWTKLGKRSGAREAWTRLGNYQPFWKGMSAKHRKVVAQFIGTHKLAPMKVAQGVAKVANHHLFESANHVGKHNALADFCDSGKLIDANTLPDTATQNKQAAALMKKHLGHMKPGSRAIMHRQVLAKANYLRKAFFEFKPGSQSKQLWGDRFVNAAGRDWYKQCLSMILTHSKRNACRSAYKQMGVHKGADVVCGKD